MILDAYHSVTVIRCPKHRWLLLLLLLSSSEVEIQGRRSDMKNRRRQNDGSPFPGIGSPSGRSGVQTRNKNGKKLG